MVIWEWTKIISPLWNGFIYIYIFIYVCLSVCLSVCPRVYAVYIQNRVQHRINGCANHKHVPRYSIQCLGGSVFLKTSNISSARSLVENAKWWLVNWLMLVPKAPYKWYSKITYFTWNKAWANETAHIVSEHILFYWP